MEAGFFHCIASRDFAAQRSLNHAAGALITGSCDYQEA